MKKNFRIVLALVLSMVMVLISVAPAFADGAPKTPSQATDYTITVRNLNSKVSINGLTYKAYKLFESRYVKDGQTVAGDDAYASDGNTAGFDQTTPYGEDDTPHAYYIKKGSPFFDATSVELVNDATPSTNKIYALKSGLTPAQEAASPLAQILDYFVLTELPGEASKPEADQFVLVTPKKDANGVSTFDATKAYELAQKMNNILAGVTSPNYVVESGAAAGETVTINVGLLGAGYYLVAGTGTAYTENDTPGGMATGNAVTAAVALTTTDPAATIIAKLDAPKVEKKIDEGATEGQIDATDLKYGEHAIGDTVPYVVESKVPNLTGYEKYFFIVKDTMSKGLKLNDFSDQSAWAQDNGRDTGFKVVIRKKNGNEVTLTRMANYDAAQRANPQLYNPAVEGPQQDIPNGINTMTYYVEKDADNNTFEIILHDFIQYKGVLITEDKVTEKGGKVYFTISENNEVEISGREKIGTYYSEWDDATIRITYSATVTDEAMLGNTGNVNAAELIFSNKPDIENGGKPGDNDKPGEGEGFEKVTDISPKSRAITYVTGLSILKFTQATVGNEEKAKLPLAHAKFSLTGEKLKYLVAESQTIYRAPKTGETADIYALKGSRFTDVEPTPDKIQQLSNGSWVDFTPSGDGDITLPAYGRILYGTLREYSQFDASTAPSRTVKTLHGQETVYLSVPNTISAQYIEDQIESYDLMTMIKAADGTYYKLKNGTFTTVDNLADSSYEDKTKKYKAVNDAMSDWEQLSIDDKNARTVTQIVETDDNGILWFRGLAAGDYTLTEIQAPDGYNMLQQPIQIKICWEKDNTGTAVNPALDQNDKDVQGTEHCTWKVYYKQANTPNGDNNANWIEINANDVIATDLFKFDVENNTGVELPSTGGIGTTIFYVGGSLMVLAAAILLITKRRMGAED